MRSVWIPLLALLLPIGVALPVAAQTTPPQSTTQSPDVPADQWVYVDMDYFLFPEREKNLRYPDWSGSRRAWTRREFAQAIAQKLKQISDLEQRTTKDERWGRALLNLVQEFTPELITEHVDALTLQRRLWHIVGTTQGVPADHWAFGTLAWLMQLHSPPHRMVPETYSLPGWTRREFVRIFVSEVRQLDERLEKELAKEPRQRALLVRTVLEFTPELRGAGIDVAALKRRIAPYSPLLTDAPADDEGRRAMEKVIRAGIFIGYPNGTFRVDKNAR